LPSGCAGEAAGKSSGPRIQCKPTPWSASVLQEKNTYGTNGKPHALTQGLRGAYTYDARGRQDTAPGRALVTYNERDESELKDEWHGVIKDLLDRLALKQV
jgi:hypothetical protein